MMEDLRFVNPSSDTMLEVKENERMCVFSIHNNEPIHIQGWGDDNTHGEHKVQSPIQEIQNYRFVKLTRTTMGLVRLKKIILASCIDWSSLFETMYIL